MLFGLIVFFGEYGSDLGEIGIEFVFVFLVFILEKLNWNWNVLELWLIMLVLFNLFRKREFVLFIKFIELNVVRGVVMLKLL